MVIDSAQTQPLFILSLPYSLPQHLCKLFQVLFYNPPPAFCLNLLDYSEKKLSMQLYNKPLYNIFHKETEISVVLLYYHMLKL